MIGSIRGKLISRRPDGVLLEAASGVGYQLSVPLGTLSNLPAEGAEAFLYVYTHVREDALQLFGFASEEEKRVFISLIGISGIGPKVAMNVLSGTSPEELMQAIEAEDVAVLTKIPGLGKKTAQRLLLELREKLPRRLTPEDNVFKDTLSALVNLGYKKTEASEVLQKAREKGHNDIEGLLKEALRLLNQGGTEA